MKKLNLALVLITLLSTLAGCSVRKIHRDLTADTNVLVRQWTLATLGDVDTGRHHGTDYSNGVLADQVFIFGSVGQGISALYPTLSSYRWQSPIAGGVLSEIALGKDAVYFAAADGHVYSVDVLTGKTNWIYDVHNAIVSRPTLSGGRLFVTTSDDVVYALDASTGKWLWHYRRRSAQNASVRAASAPLVDGQEVITGMSDGFLIALNVNDGTLKWERKLHQGVKFTDVDARPVLSDGVIYVPSYDGSLYALKRSKGEILWKMDSGGSKEVVIEGDLIYFPSNDGHVYCIQKNTARVVWKFELDEGVATKLVVTDRLIIFGSSTENIYAISRETGKGLYRFNAGHQAGFYGAPTYDHARQMVYFMSGAGNLYSFMIRPPARKERPLGSVDSYI